MKKRIAAILFSGIFVLLFSFPTFASVLISSSSITGPINVIETQSNPFYIESFKFDPRLDIDYFEINLSYSKVNSGNMEWYVTPFVGSDVKISDFNESYPYILTPSGGEQPFTFTSEFLNNYFDIFKNDGYFTLGFYETTKGDDSFTLNSATLNIYGTPAAVPIPGAMLLFGTGLLGLVGLRQRQIR